MVYQYEYWDEASMMMRTSDTYATLDAIMKGLGIPLLYTGKIVPRVAIFQQLVGALR
jgi:hypothetical protein